MAPRVVRAGAATLVRIDEPFDGVDPLGVEATIDLIEKARTAGTAVLISTHLIEIAAQACSTAVILRHGLRVATHPAAELAGESGAARYRAALAG